MRILGLDPGSRHTGYGVVDQRIDRLELCCQGRLTGPATRPVAERLGRISRLLGALVDEWQPQVAVLEAPYLGLNPRSLVILAEARGALLATLAERGIEIHEYSPAEVKSAVAGNGRADKQQVARMVAMQLAELPGDATADATDALAVAICYASRRRLDRLSGRA